MDFGFVVREHDSSIWRVITNEEREKAEIKAGPNSAFAAARRIYEGKIEGSDQTVDAFMRLHNPRYSRSAPAYYS